MNKVLIITQAIEPYRIKFYEILSAKLSNALIGIHSNKLPNNVGFNNVRSKKFTFRGFHFQFGYWGKYILKNRCKLVIAEFDLHVLSNILLLFVCKIKQIKFLWWGIGLGEYKVLFPLRKYLIRWSNGIIVYENAAKIKLIDLGIKPTKITVMGNTIFVSNPEFNEDFTKKNSILVVGRLDKRKGIDVLITVFSEIMTQLKTIQTITVIGDGPEKDNLMKLGKDLDISDRLIFMGNIIDDNILKIHFHKALVTVHPGQAGLSVLHSFAYGVPFITSIEAISGGEIENIKHGENGFLFDGSIKTLASLLCYVDANPFTVHKMGSNAFSYYMSKRSISNMGGNYYRAIEMALML
jgi:glycosyltransferase involved in cell wall biosynthesis